QLLLPDWHVRISLRNVLDHRFGLRAVILPAPARAIFKASVSAQAVSTASSPGDEARRRRFEMLVRSALTEPLPHRSIPLPRAAPRGNGGCNPVLRFGLPRRLPEAWRTKAGPRP